MPNYQNGKVYKIVSGELVYIGSTTQPTVAKRLAQHVGDYKCWKAGKRNFTTSFQLIESGDYNISLIESYPCNSKDELTARERFWIESMTCVNKCIPCRTKKEWNESNKEQIAEQKKMYREKNKEQISEQLKAYRETHKEQILEQKRAYQEKNKEQIAAYQKAYHEKKKTIV
jgi:hypothetical protein